MRVAVALILTLLATACGGPDPADDVGSATTPTGTTSPAPDPTSADAPTSTESTVTDTPAETTATPTATTEATATITLDPGDLAGRGYAVVVETADGRSVVGSLDDAGAGLPLDGIDPSTVTAVSIAAGDDPAAPQLWFGPVQDGTVQLSAVLPEDLSAAAGQYILATPTDGSDTNETSGVWYVIIPRAPGLQLPALPADWTYEGWVRIDGVDLTTGRFADPGTPDDFAGFSGPEPSAPPLPGEDFLVNPPPGVTFPVDLSGATTFVTVEPADDPHPGPSGLTILEAAIPAPAVDHTVYDLTPVIDRLPTLTGQIG